MQKDKRVYKYKVIISTTEEISSCMNCPLCYDDIACMGKKHNYPSVFMNPKSKECPLKFMYSEEENNMKKSGYDIVADAIKKYLRDYYIAHDEIERCGATTFYVLVKELEHFNWEDVWIVDIEDCGPDPEDINCTFIIDYDEGQAIEVLKVIPDYEMEKILFDYYKKEEENEQGQV